MDEMVKDIYLRKLNADSLIKLEDVIVNEMFVLRTIDESSSGFGSYRDAELNYKKYEKLKKILWFLIKYEA